LIRWIIASGQFANETNTILQAILDTEISPELVPHADGDKDVPAQVTQDVIGPYELQDFNLYYVTRYGFRPSKVAYLAYYAWHDRTHGTWPEGVPFQRQAEYDLATISGWLEVFLYRFFKTSQFKRSAIPNGPKVGSGGSLSPRGDWRAPSDSEAVAWLEELHRNVPS
jgi:NAD+ synthase (glutamine-hydrolysing)